MPRRRGARAPQARAAIRTRLRGELGRATAHTARRPRCQLLPHRSPSLSARSVRASARSTDRRCTRTPNRSVISSTSAAEDSFGSAARCSRANATTSAVSLCAPRGPGRAGHQPGQPAVIQRALGRIERRSREPERSRRPTDRLAVNARATNHLVLHLHQITRIQELRARELLIAHRLRPRIQAARLSQRSHLRILTSSCHHTLLYRCQDNSAAHIGRKGCSCQ